MRNLLRAASFASALVLGVALSGCATTYVMASDPTVPFAKGEVDATFEQNGNGRMLVKVEHLGEAGRLDPAATTYVVWLKTDNDDAPRVVNMGALRVDSDYRGELEFVTAFKKFEVMITPEKRADASEPTGRHVLQAKIVAEPRSSQKTHLVAKPSAPSTEPAADEPATDAPAAASGPVAPAMNPMPAPATPEVAPPPSTPAPAVPAPPSGASPAQPSGQTNSASEPGLSPSTTHLAP